MKKCSTCKVEKELDKFHKLKRSSDGHRGVCKICHNKDYKQYYNKNKEFVLTNIKKRFKKIESGIYMVKNLVTGAKYVGQSVTPYLRMTQHCSVIKSKNRKTLNKTNEQLQEDLNKYGREAFIFGIIEHCEEERLLEREQYYIRQMKPEYNYGE